jgi:flavin-dependent dehydrogenase
VDVALVEKVRFPRDTLSTHITEADGLNFLNRLGLIDEVRATGAPFLDEVDNRINDFRWSIPWPKQPGDAGSAVSIRRFVLDPILARAAEEAGADVRMETKVTGLLEESGRVAGVRVEGPDGPGELRARLVVGADGRNSTVARLVGSRKYNIVPSENSVYWGYFEHARIGEPTFVFHQWDDRMIVACPTDSGLYQVQVFFDRQKLPRFRADLEASYMEYATSCEPVAGALDGAQRVGKLLGMVRWEGFFRDPSGAGWVLVGDAGHFKDPAPGRGIGDAFMQVDRLAEAITSNLIESEAALDDAMAAWGRWRDDEFAEHYWFAADMGAAGPAPAVLIEVLRRLQAEGRIDLALEIINHRANPSDVLTPGRLIGGTARAVARNGGRRREVLREVAGALSDRVRRQRLERRPDYVPDQQAHADAGPTEVEQAAT